MQALRKPNPTKKSNTQSSGDSVDLSQIELSIVSDSQFPRSFNSAFSIFIKANTKPKSFTGDETESNSSSNSSSPNSGIS